MDEKPAIDESISVALIESRLCSVPSRDFSYNRLVKSEMCFATSFEPFSQSARERQELYHRYSKYLDLTRTIVGMIWYIVPNNAIPRKKHDCQPAPLNHFNMILSINRTEPNLHANDITQPSFPTFSNGLIVSKSSIPTY